MEINYDCQQDINRGISEYNIDRFNKFSERIMKELDQMDITNDVVGRFMNNGA